MKKMFYKKIKILLLLLISLFVFVPAGYCDDAEESALLTILQYAKNERQEKKANFNLLQYYMREKDYDSAITIGNQLLNYKLSKKQKYNVYYDLSNAYLLSDKPSLCCMLPQADIHLPFDRRRIQIQHLSQLRW